VGDLRRFVRVVAIPGLETEITMRDPAHRPPRLLDDDAMTIEAAELADSLVVVR
jgi:hypothetical protein